MLCFLASDEKGPQLIIENVDKAALERLANAVQGNETAVRCVQRLKRMRAVYACNIVGFVVFKLAMFVPAIFLSESAHSDFLKNRYIRGLQRFVSAPGKWWG